MIGAGRATLGVGAHVSPEKGNAMVRQIDGGDVRTSPNYQMTGWVASANGDKAVFEMRR